MSTSSSTSVPSADGAGFDLADARTADGYPIDGVTAGRLLCDSLLYRVLVRGKSAILDYGRATRAVPPPLWNVLLLRDQHCRWKGCDRPGAWCEAHHVIWWEKGGTTDIGNLVLLCFGITTSPTGPAGPPNSPPTEHSTSPTPGASPAPPAPPPPAHPSPPPPNPRRNRPPTHTRPAGTVTLPHQAGPARPRSAPWQRTSTTTSR